MAVEAGKWLIFRRFIVVDLLLYRFLLYVHISSFTLFTFLFFSRLKPVVKCTELS